MNPPNLLFRRVVSFQPTSTSHLQFALACLKMVVKALRKICNRTSYRQSCPQNPAASEPHMPVCNAIHFSCHGGSPTYMVLSGYNQMHLLYCGYVSDQEGKASQQQSELNATQWDPQSILVNNGVAPASLTSQGRGHYVFFSQGSNLLGGTGRETSPDGPSRGPLHPVPLSRTTRGGGAASATPRGTMTSSSELLRRKSSRSLSSRPKMAPPYRHKPEFKTAASMRHSIVQ